MYHAHCGDYRVNTDKNKQMFAFFECFLMYTSVEPDQHSYSTNCAHCIKIQHHINTQAHYRADKETPVLFLRIQLVVDETMRYSEGMHEERQPIITDFCIQRSRGILSNGRYTDHGPCCGVYSEYALYHGIMSCYYCLL